MRRSAGVLAAVTGLAALLAGCGHPLVPASVLKPTAVPSVIPLGKPVLGVDLYASASYAPRTVRVDGARDLAYIKETLGAQAVGIAWNFYSPGNHSARVERTHISLSPAEVEMLTREAHADHLEVEYRPLIRVSPQWTWEGFIYPYPTDQPTWFNSLYNAELPYLRIAQRLGVREFVVASELQTLNASPYWAGFLTRVARVYHGTVSYAAAETDYYNPSIARPLPVKLLGMDAYPHAALPPTATVKQLDAAWAQRFHQVSSAELARTAIDEIGIQASLNAYRKPEAWTVNQGPLDEQVQARWFTAACHFVAQHHMRGIYFWNVNLAANPAHPPFPSPSTFEGKKGAAAIRGCLRTFGEGK